MKWFSDVAMLAVEWLLLMVIPLTLGVFMGWLLWYRNWRRVEAEKKSIQKELIRCRDERDSLSVGWGEEMQSLKNKLNLCRTELKNAEGEKSQIIQRFEDEINTLQNKQSLKAVHSKAVVDAVEIPIIEETIPKDLGEHRVLDVQADVKKKGSSSEEPQQMSIIDFSTDVQMSDEAIFKKALVKASNGRVFDYEDDLKLISGVGPKMEKMLKDFGVTTFYQLSNFKDEGIHALNDRIDAFPGRIERDDWIGQAKTLHDKFHE